MSSKVGYIGLGHMGGPMATHLAKAGHDVSVYNRTRSKAEAFVSKYGGRVATSPADAVTGAAYTLGEDAPLDLRETYFPRPIDDHRARFANLRAAANASASNIYPDTPQRAAPFAYLRLLVSMIFCSNTWTVFRHEGRDGWAP